MAIVSKLFKGLAGPSVTQPNLVLVAGRVAIGATGAVGAQTGKGFTVARTGVGAYTITVTSSGGVPAILSADVSIANDSATTHFVAFVRTTPTTGVITVHTAAAATPGTAADPASGASLSLRLVVQNSAITG